MGIHEGVETLYLIATHGRWMDTYVVTLEQDEDGNWRITFDKTMKDKYPSYFGASKGLFYEGVALRRLSDTRMRVWCAPWNYSEGQCVAPPNHAKCTYFFYYYRQF